MDFFRSAVCKVPFDILHRSWENGLSLYCHMAFLFLAPSEKVITLLPKDEVELTIENTIKTISTKIIKQTQAQINMTNPTLSPLFFCSLWETTMVLIAILLRLCHHRKTT